MSTERNNLLEAEIEIAKNLRTHTWWCPYCLAIEHVDGELRPGLDYSYEEDCPECGKRYIVPINTMPPIDLDE